MYTHSRLCTLGRSEDKVRHAAAVILGLILLDRAFHCNLAAGQPTQAILHSALPQPGITGVHVAPPALCVSAGIGPQALLLAQQVLLPSKPPLQPSVLRLFWSN